MYPSMGFSSFRFRECRDCHPDCGFSAGRIPSHVGGTPISVPLAVRERERRRSDRPGPVVRTVILEGMSQSKLDDARRMVTGGFTKRSAPKGCMHTVEVV